MFSCFVNRAGQGGAGGRGRSLAPPTNLLNLTLSGANSSSSSNGASGRVHPRFWRSPPSSSPSASATQRRGFFGRPRQDEGPDYYELLGVSRNCSQDEIKVAFKKLALQYHPDRNPQGADKFKEISNAYEVLSDPERRKIYDQFGKEGVDNVMAQEGSAFHSPEDLFAQMFGGDFGSIFEHMGGAGGPRRPRKPRPTEMQIPVTLEELYVGTTKKVTYNRQRSCTSCKGTGARSADAVKQCKRCKGKGHVVQTVQMAPGFIQQSHMPCNECEGTGSVVDKKDQCPKCNGRKVIREQKVLHIDIPKGAHNEQRIVFSGEGNEEPNAPPGDVIFEIKQQPHKLFHPLYGDGNQSHLIIEKNISLADALGGVQFSFTHLDGRTITLKTPPGTVVKQGDVMTVLTEGMPTGKGNQKGDLLIRFNVEFPENNSLDEEAIKSLRKILGQPSAETQQEPTTANVASTYDLRPIQAKFAKSKIFMRQINQSIEGDRAEMDEDDEASDEGFGSSKSRRRRRQHAQQAQCTQQ